MVARPGMPRTASCATCHRATGRAPRTATGPSEPVHGRPRSIRFVLRLAVVGAATIAGAHRFIRRTLDASLFPTSPSISAHPFWLHDQAETAWFRSRPTPRRNARCVGSRSHGAARAATDARRGPRVRSRRREKWATRSLMFFSIFAKHVSGTRGLDACSSASCSKGGRLLLRPGRHAKHRRALRCGAPRRGSLLPDGNAMASSVRARRPTTSDRNPGELQNEAHPSRGARSFGTTCARQAPPVTRSELDPSDLFCPEVNVSCPRQRRPSHPLADNIARHYR
jgi:hypothetical protein